MTNPPSDQLKRQEFVKRYNDIISDMKRITLDLKDFKTTESNIIPTEGGRTHTFNLSTSELYQLSNFAIDEQMCNKEFEIEVNVTGLGRTLSIKCNECGRHKLITSSDNW